MPNRYGLLGPSGCGKTTLLTCIMGRSRLDSGNIQLSVRKKIDIGYMPQVIIIYSNFQSKWHKKMKNKSRSYE